MRRFNRFALDSPRCLKTLLVLILASLVYAPALAADDEDLDLLEQEAFKAAVASVDQSLVQIETIGGLDRVAGGVNASATTTGLVVSADGEILTSAFAFAGKPSSILVRLADGRRLAARRVATDTVTQLTLLKVEATNLKPAQAVPRDAIKVGQWSIAVGRTLDARRPSVAVGIVSAINRVWGKAIQTDAKVSPVNYGGALLDISGRVQGVLVPMSPRSPDLLAGVEWYDSGIGFAIPMENALESVTRLRAGKDLKRGMVGVTFASQALYGQEPELGSLRYESPAEKAGMKKGDVIVAVDGEPVSRVAQVRHALGNKYAGDTIAMAYDRGGKTTKVEMQLVDSMPPWEPGFLGILPARLPAGKADGTRVRAVVPGSAVSKVGLKSGDVVTSLDGEKHGNSEELSAAARRIRPGAKVSVTFTRDGKERTAKVNVGAVPGNTISNLTPIQIPKPVKGPEVKTGRYLETFESHQHEFWAYVPDGYNADHPYGLITWLHPGGDTMEAKILESWKPVCDARGLILVSPKAAKLRGWNPNELEFVKDTLERMQQRYPIDPQRVVVHGHQSSAPVAYKLAFENREIIRGVVTTGGALETRPPENRPEYPLQFCIFGGEKDRGFARTQATANGLRGLKFPVVFEQAPAAGADYPSADVIQMFGRWVDSLDRI